jgi:fatty acyl-ACP thioesterase B
LYVVQIKKETKERKKEMNALYNLALCPTSCSHSTPKHNTKWKTEVNGTATVALKGKALSRASSVTGKQRRIVSAASVTELTRVSETKGRQNIPTEKQLVDPFRQGIITEGGVRYRQTVVIRSYEVGADKTATLESILNLLQVNYLTETFCVFVKITESILKHFTLKFS